MGDSLLQIIEKGGHILIVLNVVGESLQLQLPVQRLQLSLDVFKLAGKESISSARRGIAAYRINSFRRLCSATSPGGVAKSVPSVVIRERRPPILFLTTKVSCR